eukprot:m.772200 g.772200  ORF g.772200 m.772200 type:complete len:173 (-) comp23246_c0_seq25:14-532(-)
MALAKRKRDPFHFPIDGSHSVPGLSTRQLRLGAQLRRARGLIRAGALVGCAVDEATGSDATHRGGGKVEACKHGHGGGVRVRDMLGTAEHGTIVNMSRTASYSLTPFRFSRSLASAANVDALDVVTCVPDPMQEIFRLLLARRNRTRNGVIAVAVGCRGVQTQSYLLAYAMS